MKKAIIIGSGIAGIACSIRLKGMGYNVSVFEANSYPGGKLSEINLGSYRFDAGPSLFTLPNLVEELISSTGKSPSDYFNYEKRDVICNYFWEDGTVFSADSNAKTFAQEAANLFDVDASQIEAYLEHSEKIYNLTSKVFLESSLHKSSTYLSLGTLKAIVNIFGMNISKTVDAVNRERLIDPKLVQLFNRFITYNGSSPYKAPGIFTMIPHLEHNLGAYFPKGGMYSITQSLFRLAKDIGVQFHFENPVKEILINNKTAIGIRASEEVLADIVVSNMDVVPTYNQLMPSIKAPESTLTQERSSSAIIFYWGIKKEFPSLDLHNIFFSDDYKKEFKSIFQDNTISNDPTIYIHISSKAEKSDAPKGCENWFVMINVPSNRGQDWKKLITQSRANILNKLSRILKVEIEPLIQLEELLTPELIESKTSSYQGALYGASSNSKFSAFLRHPNFKKSISGLYFAGGSVHPGGGIPLCLLSAQIVADLIPKP
ncbi:MAG: phytoene desaturase [Crocinitomicaceae bacterium]|nr:phytoene desaturase [Crocinitomicaceae bacterium]